MKNILFLALWIFFSVNAFAGVLEEKGLKIAREADRVRSGFSDSRSDLVMIMKDSHGHESFRSLDVRILERKEDGNMSMTIFQSPADVKGTAFLVSGHKITSDDQWLYLPALKRVKRIASDDKSGSFMGSEFAYEDIGAQAHQLEKYTYRYLREEAYDKMPCFVIERRPLDPNSGYKRQEVWIDQTEYQNRKIDYYDRKGSLLKTLTYRNYQHYQDRFWRAIEWFVVNHQTGKSTLVTWNNWRFGTGLTKEDFSQEALKRVK